VNTAVLVDLITNVSGANNEVWCNPAGVTVCLTNEKLDSRTEV